MGRRKCIGSVVVVLVFERKPEEPSVWVGEYRLIYSGRRTTVCVPIQPGTVSIWLVTAPIQLVAHAARKGFKHCVVYCLLPPTLYFAGLGLNPNPNAKP